MQASAAATVVQYGILFTSAALLKEYESLIDFVPSVVLITNSIFFAFRLSTM